MTEFKNSLPSEASHATERQVFSVSQLNRKVRQLLETHLPLLWIEGELSNLAKPSSGHWYFTLKDQSAQVKCAMFRNRSQYVRFTPQQGQKVLIRARVSLYEGRGDYQLIAEHMEEAGFGNLQQAFDALKLQLNQEGLFAADYKRPIPSLPKHIGVITSPTGAAIRDILHVAQRRFPSIPISIFPVAVQGQDAAPQIVRALQTANELSDCDLLIVGRGGGSLEDLWPFNEESVARAIFDSHIPVISAVGHEVDITIADFVADVRAPTPSAAAELATPNAQDMSAQFQSLASALYDGLYRRLQRHHEQISHLSSRIQHPGQRLNAQAQHLDNLEIRLQKSIHNQLQRLTNALQQLQVRHNHQNPKSSLHQKHKDVTSLEQRLTQLTQQALKSCRQQLQQQVALLDSVNPLSILQRGYSTTADSNHCIVTNSHQVKVGDQINTRLKEGRLVSTVTSVTE